MGGLDESLSRMSSLGKTNNTMGPGDSFSHGPNANDEDVNRVPSVVDTAEYGMPITEDADNIPAMGQL